MLERVDQIVKKAQAGLSLQKSSQQLITVEKDGATELTVYRGELKQETVASSVAKIKAAFPSLTRDFFAVFIERLKDKGFTDERLIDAVNNVIDNCQYPTPTLANFLSFDKRVKVISYTELVNIVTRNEASFESYSPIVINGKRFYVRASDKELYNLPEEL